MNKNIIELFTTIIKSVNELNQLSSEYLDFFPMINLSKIEAFWFEDLDYIGLTKNSVSYTDYMDMLHSESKELKTILPTDDGIEIGEYVIVQERENDEYYVLKLSNKISFTDEEIEEYNNTNDRLF